MAAPFCVELFAVTGDSGALLDHRGPPADDAVDQGGLAHVRSSGHHHQGLGADRDLVGGRGHRGAPMVTGTLAGVDADNVVWTIRPVPSRARRSDNPSVGTTSTARGRSS